MPYNNTAIPEAKPEEATGQAALPLARVKRILHVDEDINNCSNNAAFVITVATEMFVQHLAKQAHNVAKSERKPRRNIAYNHLGIFESRFFIQSCKLTERKATVVSRVDNLQFLSDVIPRTIPYNQYKEKASKGPKKGGVAAPDQVIMNGDRVSDQGSDLNSDVEGAEVAGVVDPSVSPVRTQNLEVRIRSERPNGFKRVEDTRTQEDISHEVEKDEDME
ncbi:MAG: hypothetical protein M1836_006278 [Candelina mexicana]|nr:MAG: hypothetical protein M1836_006278 [Candelina mexicana]